MVSPIHSATERLLTARLHDPFSLLGTHRDGDTGWILRVFRPCASHVELLTPTGFTPLMRIDARGLFIWQGTTKPNHPARLRIHEDGHSFEIVDPYGFDPLISNDELHLFAEGRLLEAWRSFGAQVMTLNGVGGVRFVVWAPNCERASVVGDFNTWDGRCHPMRARDGGVWELFIPGLTAGDLYRFELRNRDSGTILTKTDPYARHFERRPGTACVVPAPAGHPWQDQDWMIARAHRDWLHAPMNIYEVHAGSWRRHPDAANGRFYTWREMADSLVPYAVEMGYTHLELLPITEHPLDESWGYQATGYFAPTSRFGSPDDLRHFIDTCHQAGLGVLLDWVPGHFPQDAWALARYDGSALYEHEDPRQGLHQDWGTHIFNYGRNEVRGFLLASAHYWLSEFHFDGLRVDAVASMLYLDYSRKAGEWIPNKYGGRENLDAIAFLREMNAMVHETFPGALTLAEESTSWPMVSRPTYVGGLGFSMKWNMGWMNDTLAYLHLDPVFRRYHHSHLTFGQLYAYSENFVLPFSHDEVVHGKGSLLGKMPGDAWQQFANLRLLLTYQIASPGKKLNFMGNELAQGREWSEGRELDWSTLQLHWHEGVQRCARDLNRLYRDTPALFELDFNHEGFAWIDCHDADQSILSFLRRDLNGGTVICAFNFTPVLRHGYRLGCPQAGHWRELFNSDSAHYSGSNQGNGAGLESQPQPWMGMPHSIVITLPPLSGIILHID